MNVRAVVWLGWLALLPSWSAAQTCTMGPFTSSTALSTIGSQINSAPNNSVICLQRGQTWSSASALSLSASRAASAAVTICSSDSSQCTTSGAADATISITGNTNCVSFTGSASGYNFKQIDCAIGAQNTATALSIPHGVSNISFEGGSVRNYWQWAFFEGGSGPLANNIRLGTCAAPIDIGGTPPNNPNVGDRHLAYGSVTNSGFSVNVHDFTGFQNNATDHMFDFTRGTAASHLNPSDGTSNTVVECSTFTYTNMNGKMGSFIKFALGANNIVRDNVVNVSPGSGSCPSAIYFALGATHNSTNETEGLSGGAAYRNQFNTGPCKGAFYIAHAQNVDIYNNVLNATAADEQRGFLELDYSHKDLDAGQDDLPISGIRVFNNTMYRTGNSSAVGNGWPMFHDNTNPPPNWPAATGSQIFNNLVYDTDAVDAKVWNMRFTGCGGFGSNGASIQNNFVYTPNDSTPADWNTCSGAKGNSTSYNVNPGLPSLTSGSMAIGASSAVVGKGMSSGAPSDDFMKNPRPSPPAIGAFDVGSVGGVTPLSPPTLVQISTN